MFKNYFDNIIETSESYLRKEISETEYTTLLSKLKKYNHKELAEYIYSFNKEYSELVKKKYQKEYKDSDKKFPHGIVYRKTGITNCSSLR